MGWKQVKWRQTTGYGSKPVKTLLFSPKQLGIKDVHPPNHHIDGYIYIIQYMIYVLYNYTGMSSIPLYHHFWLNPHQINALVFAELLVFCSRCISDHILGRFCWAVVSFLTWPRWLMEHRRYSIFLVDFPRNLKCKKKPNNSCDTGYLGHLNPVTRLEGGKSRNEARNAGWPCMATPKSDSSRNYGHYQLRSTSLDTHLASSPTVVAGCCWDIHH